MMWLHLHNLELVRKSANELCDFSHHRSLFAPLSLLSCYFLLTKVCNSLHSLAEDVFGHVLQKLIIIYVTIIVIN